MLLIFVKCMGIIMSGFGVAFLLDQNLLKRYISYFFDEKKLRIGTIIKIIIGILFVMAAPGCEGTGFIRLVGIITIIAGIIPLVSGMEKTKNMLTWVSNRPKKTVRTMGIVYVVFGALVIFAA